MRLLKHYLVCAGLALIASMISTAAELCVTTTDEGRQALPKARVGVRNLLTGNILTGETGGEGRVCLQSIPEGLYSVTVSLAGFLNVKYYPVRVSYPQKHALTVTLPLGEITEGRIADDAILSGTLGRDGAAIKGAKICLVTPTGSRIACTVTDDLGEYSLSVPTGVYDAEMTDSGGTVYRQSIDLSTPGAIYHDRLVFPSQRNPRK